MDGTDISKMNVAQLAELIEKYDKLYWELNAPAISDQEYDRLVEALRKLDPEHYLVNRVNAVAVESSGKVHHKEPMLSLDKAYSLEEILAWANKYARSPQEALLVEPKYDGISASFDGKVLATRGDGETGENISDKLPLLELEALEYTGKVDRPARGEIVIRTDDFINIYSRIRKKGGGTYKNPRNAVAGIMGLKDIAEMVMQGAKLTLVDYNLVSIPVSLQELPERWESLKTELAVLPYPMDGIVIKLADSSYRRTLGNTAHHPRGEIAYKFTNAKATTVLEGVEWSFGKNCLTPVALLAPVDLSGITIKRASLHNAQNLEDMQIMIGDTVTVERAGDVIPYITASTPGECRRSPWISECPSCRSSLIRRGPELCCPNPECPETLLCNLLASVRSFGIERLGEPTLRKLMEKFQIRHLYELLTLNVNDLLSIEGFQQRSAQNLADELAKSRTTAAVNIIAALNIPNVGSNIAALLLEKHSFEELRTLDQEQLAAIPGIGPERAGAICSAFRNGKAELDKLLEVVELQKSEPSDSNLPTVCFTGKMPEKRSYYENVARKLGMRPVDSVSSSLDLLVTADLESGSSKIRNARKFGIKIITPDEFMKMEVPGESSVEKEENFSEAWERGELF